MLTKSEKIDIIGNINKTVINQQAMSKAKARAMSKAKAVKSITHSANKHPCSGLYTAKTG